MIGQIEGARVWALGIKTFLIGKGAQQVVWVGVGRRTSLPTRTADSINLTVACASRGATARATYPGRDPLFFKDCQPPPTDEMTGRSTNRQPRTG